MIKAQFVGIMRSTMVQAGGSISGYSGHSFRIGAAMAAVEAKIPYSTIQALGWWSNSAFLRYTCTPQEHLTQFSTSLACR